MTNRYPPRGREAPQTALMAVDKAALQVAESAGFNAAQVTMLQQMVAKNCTIAEVGLFAQYCRKTGLDPFSRQIYAIKRGTQMTIQVSIDGLRTLAERSGTYEGQTEPQYLDSAGQWHDVWLPGKMPGVDWLGGEDGENGPLTYPLAARVGVYRKGFRAPIYGMAKWEAYAQVNEEWEGESGNRRKTGRLVLGDMWRKMPELMLAKCAEALALRKACPTDMSGLYTHDEMDQASGRGAIPIEIEGRTLDEVDRAAAASDDNGEPLDGEVIPPPANRRRRAPEKSPEEQEWERQNPPAQPAPRQPVAAARPAAQRPSPAPAPANTETAPNPRQDLKTLTKAMQWANGTYGLSSEEMWGIAGVTDNNGLKNLGVTKFVDAILAWDARRTVDEADQSGDIDPDDLPF